MPRNRDYIDKEARIGRPRLAPSSEINLQAKTGSRSLDNLLKEDSIKQYLQCEIRKTGYLHIKINGLPGDKIKISKKNTIAFANWIMKSYESNKARTRSNVGVNQKD